MSLECASSEDPLDLLLADDNLELLLSTTDIEMAPADEDEKPSSPVVKTESFPIEMEIAEPTCVPAIGGAVTEWPASAASEPELSMAAVVPESPLPAKAGPSSSSSSSAPSTSSSS